MSVPSHGGASLDPRAPFSVASARAAGITDRKLHGKRYTRVFTGVYVSVETRQHPLIRTRAALLIHPPFSFASHTSAARVYGAPLPDGLSDEHITVLAQRDRRRRRGIVHHLAARDADVVLHNGIRVSAPLPLFLELAAQLNLVDLVVVGDWLVGKGAFTPEELRAHCSATTARHAVAARRAAGYVRAEVDSPMETRLRMLLVLAGLPEPDVNFKVRTEDGEVILRFDLSYPDLLIAIEYDGRQHRADLDQWDKDQDRQDWFDDRGWRHVTVFSRGIYRSPDKTIARVAGALASRGVRVQVRDDWRPYFPVRG